KSSFFMNSILPLITVATASLVAIATASGQTTALPPAPTKAKNAQHAKADAKADAKEQAEDAALLQQLETSGPDVENGPRHAQNHWAVGAPPAGFMNGVAPAVVSDRLQTVLGRASV